MKFLGILILMIPNLISCSSISKSYSERGLANDPSTQIGQMIIDVIKFDYKGISYELQGDGNLFATSNQNRVTGKWSVRSGVEKNLITIEVPGSSSVALDVRYDFLRKNNNHPVYPIRATLLKLELLGDDGKVVAIGLLTGKITKLNNFRFLEFRSSGGLDFVFFGKISLGRDPDPRNNGGFSIKISFEDGSEASLLTTAVSIARINSSRDNEADSLELWFYTMATLTTKQVDRLTFTGAFSIQNEKVIFEGSDNGQKTHTFIIPSSSYLLRTSTGTDRDFPTLHENSFDSALITDWAPIHVRLTPTVLGSDITKFNDKKYVLKIGQSSFKNSHPLTRVDDCKSKKPDHKGDFVIIAGKDGDLCAQYKSGASQKKQ